MPDADTTIRMIRESTERGPRIVRQTNPELAMALQSKLRDNLESYTEQSDLLEEAIYRLEKWG